MLVFAGSLSTGRSEHAVSMSSVRRGAYYCCSANVIGFGKSQNQTDVTFWLLSPCDAFDRTCRHFPCPPEVKSQRWEMEEPEHSSTFPLRPPTEDDESRDRGGSCKRVTMASVSRYLTDRRYLVRRPLVSAQHTSILKKMETEEVRLTASSLEVL